MKKSNIVSQVQYHTITLAHQEWVTLNGTFLYSILHVSLTEMHNYVNRTKVKLTINGKMHQKILNLCKLGNFDT